MHIHKPQPSEEIVPGSGKYYKHLEVPCRNATVWHFRKLKDGFKIYETQQTNNLAPLANILETGFKNRLNSGELGKF